MKKTTLQPLEKVSTTKVIKGIAGKKLQESEQQPLKQVAISAKLPVETGLTAIKNTPLKKWFRPLFILLTTFLIGGLVLDRVLASISSRPWLGYPLALIALGLVSLVIYKIREIQRTRKRIRYLQHFKNRLMQIHANSSPLMQHKNTAMSTREIKRNFKQFAECLPLKFSANYPAFLSSIEPHHETDEIVKLYELMVLAPVDAAAKRQIIQDSSKLSGIVAISTLPIVDTVATFWFALRLLRKLSALYGYRSLSGWYLMKSAFNSALIAGGSEALIHLSTDDLLSGLSEKLSKRIAQGAAAGVLTARLGFTAQVYLRHLPFTEKQTSILKQIGKELRKQWLDKPQTSL